MPFTAVIVDDEPLAIEALRRFCIRAGRIDLLGEACDGPAGLLLMHSVQPDVVLLDIGMPGLSGLQIAKLLTTMPKPPLVVFVTAFDHFATEAFDLAVVDYVLKPLQPLRFQRAINRVESRLLLPAAEHPGQDFWLPSRGAMVRVAAAAIRRVEAERDYVRLFTDESSFLLREPMSSLEARLSPASFVRIHRSTILRRDTVISLKHLGSGAWAVVDDRGQVNRIGRHYLAAVRHSLLHFT